MMAVEPFSSIPGTGLISAIDAGTAPLCALVQRSRPIWQLSSMKPSRPTCDHQRQRPCEVPRSQCCHRLTSGLSGYAGRRCADGAWRGSALYNRCNHEHLTANHASGWFPKPDPGVRLYGRRRDHIRTRHPAIWLGVRRNNVEPGKRLQSRAEMESRTENLKPTSCLR